MTTNDNIACSAKIIMKQYDTHTEDMEINAAVRVKDTSPQFLAASKYHPEVIVIKGQLTQKS